jgi:hypothetical protein
MLISNLNWSHFELDATIFVTAKEKGVLTLLTSTVFQGIFSEKVEHGKGNVDFKLCIKQDYS